MTAEEPSGSSEPVRDEGRSKRLSRRLLVPTAVVLFAGLSTTWLDVIARHATNANSDSATVVLEGQAMNAGHLLLSGWSLSLDSFWSVDVPFYALAIRLFGLTRNLIFTVPSVIAALVVLVVALMAVGTRRRLAALVGVLLVAIPLALPSRAFSIFFVQGPFHVATTLFALLAFALVANNRFGWRWGLAVCFLVAGALGDFQAAALSIVPIFLTGVVAADISKRWRAALPLMSAPLVALVAYYVIREITKQIGSFTIARANSLSSTRQSVHNLEHLPRFLSGLAGIGSRTFGVTGVPSALQAFGVVRLAIFVGGPLIVLISILRRLPVARRSGTGLSFDEILDTFLLIAFAMDLVMFVILPLTSVPAYGRYLTAGIIFGTLLGGRVVTRFLASRSQTVNRVALAVALVCTGVFAVSAFDESRGNPVYQPAATMAAFLQAQHLTSGVGDYWSASITTVESGGVVRVRPVISLGGHLVRYQKNSTADWYSGKRFNFFVYEPTSLWNGDTERAAVRDWGPPSRIWRIGPYRIVVFQHYFSVPVNGWIGP